MKDNFEGVIKDIMTAVLDNRDWLAGLSEEVVTVRRNGQGRSIKQILGHLIDSAGNNHQRIVRLQYNRELVFPDYTSHNDLWITLQDYQNDDWEVLVNLWVFYNIHIMHIIKSVDHTKLDNYWHDENGHRVTLREMIGSYYPHLVLHLKEIRELAEA